MSYGYSTDLRKRVLSYIDNGGQQTQASILFGVSRKTIYNWLKLREDSGDLQMRRSGKKVAQKIDDQKLSAYVSEHPDAYLHEIAAVFNVSESGIFRALKRIGITRKKKRRSI